MTWKSGTIIKDKWRIDSVLGEGGMATVYAATHRNGSRMALKFLHVEYGRHEEVRKRFIREGYAANAVDHPGVVRVFDDDMTNEGEVFLVMELLEGVPLDVVHKRMGKQLPHDPVLSIADQVLDVLAVAHAKQIVHRDIKPQNIFLTNSNTIKLLDFGIARLRDGAHAVNPTMTGAFMGTPAYVPPEQARGRWEWVDGRSDIWALGATMYHLLTGELVHGSCTPSEQLVAAMTKPARSIALARPDLSKEIVEIVDRALAFDRENRWPDARTMQAAIRRAMQSTNEATSKTAQALHTIPLATQVWRRSDAIAAWQAPVAAEPMDLAGETDSTILDEKGTKQLTAGPVAEDIPPPPQRRSPAPRRKLVLIGLAASVTLMIWVLVIRELNSPAATSISQAVSASPVLSVGSLNAGPDVIPLASSAIPEKPGDRFEAAETPGQTPSETPVGPSALSTQEPAPRSPTRANPTRKKITDRDVINGKLQR